MSPARAEIQFSLPPEGNQLTASLTAMEDRLRLTFEPEIALEPWVCRMAKEFDVTFSIRRADIQPTAGWLDLSLEGEQSEIDRAVAWLRENGVRVTPAGGDVVAG